MKCIVLVGGYATRMHPIAVNKPKALLELNDNTVLDNILDNIIRSSNIIDEYILVTNDTFYEQFINWKNKNNYKENITIISDGSTSKDNKIGSVSAVIKTINDSKIDDDILIMAGDNIIDFSLQYIFDEFINNNNSCIMYYEEQDKKKLSKTGIIELDDNNFVLGMEEKPINPKTNYAVPPFYWLKKKDIKKLLSLFSNNTKIDAMGEIILSLCQHTKIKGLKMNGKRYDIGSIDEYHSLKQNRR